MPNSFDKRLSHSEVKWNFLRIPQKHKHLFQEDEVFEINYEGKTFPLSINKAQRIVSRDLFQELTPHKGSVLTITKKSRNEYIVTLK